MIEADIRAIADSILFEGYALYPDRHFRLKSQQRWTFGTLFPQPYAERGDGERWYMRCECLLRAAHDAEIGVTLRFLQMATCRHHPYTGKNWEEAIACEWTMPPQRLSNITVAAFECNFGSQAVRSAEPATARDQGLIVRQGQPAYGRAIVQAVNLKSDLYRFSLRFQNLNPITEANCLRRQLALPFAFASTHAVLAIDRGAWLSWTDPPKDQRTTTAACSNEGCWPVLAGNPEEARTVLVTPVALSDYPQIVLESADDFLAGAEM
jgi:hypothetical protein